MVYQILRLHVCPEIYRMKCIPITRNAIEVMTFQGVKLNLKTNPNTNDDLTVMNKVVCT